MVTFDEFKQSWLTLKSFLKLTEALFFVVVFFGVEGGGGVLSLNKALADLRYHIFLTNIILLQLRAQFTYLWARIMNP